jgi:hypothetical protein
MEPYFSTKESKGIMGRFRDYGLEETPGAGIREA